MKDAQQISATQVAFQVASLVNTKEVAVGDMVTFDLGFDKKKNRPEGVNIHKATNSQKGPILSDDETPRVYSSYLIISHHYLSDSHV